MDRFVTISSKTFVTSIFVTMVLFLLFHILTWSFFTKNILHVPPHQHIGDLARLSYEIGSMQVRPFYQNTLSRQHIPNEDWNLSHTHLVIIGDSYSRGGGHGTDNFYANHLASMHSLDIINTTAPNPDDTLDQVIAWINSGLLDKNITDAILIESVERAAVKRFSKTVDWNMTLPHEEIVSQLKKNIIKTENSINQNIKFINTGNYSFWKYKIQNHVLKKHVASAPVYLAQLDHKLFSVPNDDTLLFYNEDVRNQSHVNPVNIKQLNKNLNHLAELLREKGITLYFMPIVDKYNLYSPYIEKNPYPQSHFFEELRPLEKSYEFIDTKAILSPMLPHSIDLFYADDTHWNAKAAAAVARQIKITP